MLNDEVSSNDIGKMMSDNHDFLKSETFLKSHDSEDALIKSIEIQHSKSRELTELTIKGTLGSEFFKKNL